MKYRVVGWTFDDDVFYPTGKNTHAAQNAIIDEIKQKGYIFSGWDHQETFDAVPILNDGKKRSFSRRGWGALMAEAYGKTGLYDYAQFSDSVQKRVYPTNVESFYKVGITPEPDLAEEIVLTVPFEWRDDCIALHDYAFLRYLDTGDKLVINGDRYDVLDVTRKKDLTYNERVKLELDMQQWHDQQRANEAKRKFDETKIVLLVQLAKCQ